MNLTCKTKIEKAWLVAGLSIFIAHRLLDASSHDYYSPAAPLRLFLELSMIVISFPFGGLTLFALHAAMFWCDDCRSFDFLFDWSTLLLAGYIQWFWVLPEFLRGRKLTLLDLRRTAEVVSTNSAPAVTAAATTTATTATPDPLPVALPQKTALPDTRAPRRAFDASAYVPRRAEFDEAGLTALGRVLQAQTQTAAEALPPPAEVIFPQVN